MARTDFYVNVSKAEGLCIPLMEFMSCGKPAIAPRHTSMLDYLDDANSIAIAAGTEPCIWPHDDRGVLRSLQYRVNWESAVAALRHSRELFLADPPAYRGMGAAAMAAMRAYCSVDSVLARMRRVPRRRSPGDASRMIFLVHANFSADAIASDVGRPITAITSCCSAFVPVLQRWARWWS